MIQWIGELIRYPSWPGYLQSTFWIVGVTVALILCVAFTTLCGLVLPKDLVRILEMPAD